MDAGLLAGLAEGIKSGVSSYREARSEALRRKQMEQQQILQAMEHGFEIDEAGNLVPSEFKKKEQESKKAEFQRLESEKDPFSRETQVARGLAKGLLPSADLPEDMTAADIKRYQGLLEASARAQGEREKRAEEKAKPKEYKDFQYQAGGFAKRMETSGSIIDQLENDPEFKITSVKTSLQQKIPGLLGGLKDPKVQSLEQAQRDFVNAVLRRESGAAISPSEFESAQKQYFPQPGDTAEVLAQKSANRKQATEAIKATAGGAYGEIPTAKKPKVVSPEDKDAIEWLNSNPNHPDAKAVREKLKSKGAL